MSAEAIWHTHMAAVPRGDRDKMPGYFAPDCTRTLTPPGTTSGFTSRGAAGAERAARFAGRPRRPRPAQMISRASPPDESPRSRPASSAMSARAA